MIIRSLQELRGCRFSHLSITLRLKYILLKLETFSVYFRPAEQGVSCISTRTAGRHIWTMRKRFVTCLGASRLLGQISIVPNPLNKYRSRGINVACRTRYICFEFRESRFQRHIHAHFYHLQLYRRKGG